jgi:hypothetical protein
MSRIRSVGDFDVVTGPPAPPAVLQKPVAPPPTADRMPGSAPLPAAYASRRPPAPAP